MPIHRSSESGRPVVVTVICAAPLIRTGLVAALSQEPTLAVAGGREAHFDGGDAGWLEALAGIDVVVADLDNALSIARVLQRHGAARRTLTARIMVVAQHERESEIRHALEQGIQGYLSLGCGLDEMVQGVLAVHRGHRHLGFSAAQRLAESLSHQALTSREIEVLHLIAAGYANKRVAHKLEIALGTVKGHVKSILGKLGARSRTEAAAVALRRGLCAQAGELPVDGKRLGRAPSRSGEAMSL